MSLRIKIESLCRDRYSGTFAFKFGEIRFVDGVHHLYLEFDGETLRYDDLPLKTRRKLKPHINKEYKKMVENDKQEQSEEERQKAEIIEKLDKYLDGLNK